MTLAATSTSQKPNTLKENIKNIPKLLGFLLILGDVFSIIIAQFLALKCAVVLKSQLTSELIADTTHYDQHTNLFLILGIIMTVVLYDKGLYTSRIPWWSQVQYITRIVFFSLIVQGFLSFALKLNEPRSLIIFSWFFVLTFMVAFRITFFKLAKFLPTWQVPTVIISEGSTSEDLLYAFHSDLSTGYVVRKIFIRSPEEAVDLDIASLSGDQKQVKICYGQEDHCHYISSHPDNFFVISLDTFRDSSREDIIRTLNDTNVPYAIVPTLSRANLYQMEPKYFFGHDVVMLHIKNSDSDVLRTFIEQSIKRTMDIAISGLALLFTDREYIGFSS
jgi:FlaA1/EpsC-like NDP-sugar epimerase